MDTEEEGPTPGKSPSLIASIYAGDEEGNPNRIRYWLRHKQWPLAVAAALFSDADPDSLQFNADRTALVTVRTLRESEFVNDDEAHEDEGSEQEESPQARDARLKRHYQQIRDLERLLGGFNPRREFATPAEWITAARELKIHVPWLAWAEWEKRVKLAPAPEVTNERQDAPVEKERQSMLKIIAALCAIGDIDITHATSSAVTIRDQCQRMGLGISEGTVTKYLKDARSLLPLSPQTLTSIEYAAASTEVAA